MRMSINKCVGIYNDVALIWCFPIEIFKACKEVYILTYMFDAQIQKYYYDFYNTRYDYMYVEKINNTYVLKDKQQKYNYIFDYKNKINILDNEKLNSIGDKETALSVSWFIRDRFMKNKPLINTLKKNIYNYFKNIIKTPSDLNMWTTFKDFKQLL